MKLGDLLVSEANDGKIFTAKFTKKDGTERTMVARLRVSKDVKGTGSGSAFPYVNVFDMQKNGWRKINVEKLHYLKMHGVEHYESEIKT